MSAQAISVTSTGVVSIALLGWFSLCLYCVLKPYQESKQRKYDEREHECSPFIRDIKPSAGIKAFLLLFCPPLILWYIFGFIGQTVKSECAIKLDHASHTEYNNSCTGNTKYRNEPLAASRD